MCGLFLLAQAAYADDEVSTTVQNMEKVCNLTKQQVTAVKPIVAEYYRIYHAIMDKAQTRRTVASSKSDVASLNNINNEMNRQIDALNQDYHQKLSKVLTPSQLAKWRSYSREQLHKLMQAMGVLKDTK